MESLFRIAWPKILVLIVTVVITAVLIWHFAPINKALSGVLPGFNTTSLWNGSDTQTAPTAAPTLKDSYNFMQCADPTKNCCNGLDNICDLRVDQILYACPHNGMATYENGFLFGPNHLYEFEKSLPVGYRGQNFDLCNCNGVYQHCHGVCNLGARSPLDVWGHMNDFLDQNPTEILHVTIEINNAVDLTIDLFAFYAVLSSINGLTEKLYVHSNISEPWPTLREVIAANTVRPCRVPSNQLVIPRLKSCPCDFVFFFVHSPLSLSLSLC